MRKLLSSPIWRFNPRPRTGSDELAAHVLRSRGVSIHAPARGATSGVKKAPLGGLFQSTPPHGERL